MGGTGAIGFASVAPSQELPWERGEMVGDGEQQG